MAIYNNPNQHSKMTMRPGGRGERVDGNRINRSNYTLNTSAHAATNSKYGMDDRLQVEFKYGYGAGYNQMLITKGRVVAIDPYLEIFDAETQKYDNALTLANGGNDVDFDKTGHWVAATTAFELDEKTGRDKNEDLRRPANTPIGILVRNEYTRDINAFNGIIPGAVNTDCMTELPLFASQEKAKANPWGSAWGSLKPGDLVKSDTTGRIMLSPLCDSTWLLGDATATPVVAGASAGEIELERQQVIGQVYEVRKELVPMGAAKYAQWALSDILEFEEFNPTIKRHTNRRGEDHIETTPYVADGKAPMGYESTLTEHDLHMMALKGSRGNYNKRMQHRYRFDFGIPGLTDGYNAVKNTITNEEIGTVVKTAPKGTELIFRINATNIESTCTINGVAVTEAASKDAPVAIGTDSKLEVIYFNALQGLVTVRVKAALTADAVVKITYDKRGQAGVPTVLDWDGCVGTIKILLQK